MKNNRSSFEVPATFSEKAAKFTVIIDHDILHNTNGKVFDMNFCTVLGNKLNEALPSKNELTHINGVQISNDDTVFAGWSEQDLDGILRNDEWYRFPYIENQDVPLNPSGIVSITFDFV